MNRKKSVLSMAKCYQTAHYNAHSEILLSKKCQVLLSINYYGTTKILPAFQGYLFYAFSPHPFSIYNESLQPLGSTDFRVYTIHNIFHPNLIPILPLLCDSGYCVYNQVHVWPLGHDINIDNISTSNSKVPLRQNCAYHVTIQRAI